MQKRRIFINALMSVAQIVIISGVLFVLYKFLVQTIGIEQLGIWSLVLATTSVTQIANFGLSGSVVKFVAKYIARGEIRNVSEAIQTAVVSVTAIVGAVLIFGYPLIAWVLRLVVPQNALPLAISILPYALLALWIMVITSIFQSGLDGYQRIDLRSILLIGGAFLHLFLCFVLAPRFGLIGLAYAKVIQNVVVLIASWVLLKAHLTILPVIRYHWNMNLFKEIIGYGASFQVITVAKMLYDPITKALLARFGGLSIVGYYEMASKLIHQLRALIVSANQVLVPTFAGLYEKSPGTVQKMYLTSYRLLFYLAMPAYSLLIICAPIISIVWLGYYERTFVFLVSFLSIGWLINTLNAPAYFVNLGIGALRWNVISHIAIGLLNAGLGYLLGVSFGGGGVVIAWVLSLTLGSSLIYVSYHIIHTIPLTEILPKSSVFISIICMVGVIFAFTMINTFDNINNPYTGYGIFSMLFAIITLISLWFHPMRKRMTAWVLNDLIQRKI